MENFSELARFMGGPTVVGSPESDFEFINIIRTGFPCEVIDCVVKSSAISEDIICQSLHIAKRTAVRRKASASQFSRVWRRGDRSKRTAARRKSSASRLKPSESELIYRFSKVLVTATEILGDTTKAREWLLSENRALNGNRPIDLLDTAIGFEDVMDVLHRIEYGVYS